MIVSIVNSTVQSGLYSLSLIHAWIWRRKDFPDLRVFSHAVSETHQSSLRFDQRPIDPVHLVVETAGVTQVMTRPVPPPQRSGHRPAVHTLPTLGEIIQQLWAEHRYSCSEYFTKTILSVRASRFWSFNTVSYLF